jgi:septal ring factor EnvC (AmiA/AmiB activator)
MSKSQLIKETSKDSQKEELSNKFLYEINEVRSDEENSNANLTNEEDHTEFTQSELNAAAAIDAAKAAKREEAAAARAAARDAEQANEYTKVSWGTPGTSNGRTASTIIDPITGKRIMGNNGTLINGPTFSSSYG